MKDGMKRPAPPTKEPYHGSKGKDGHWDGGGGLGNKGERHEGTGKDCRGEAAKRGFGKA